MSAKRSLLIAVVCVVALFAALVPPTAPVAAAGLPYAINLTLDRTSQVVSSGLGAGEGVTATVTIVDSTGAPVLYTGAVVLEFSAPTLVGDVGWVQGPMDRTTLQFQAEPRKSVRLTTMQAGDNVVTARAGAGDLHSARSPITFTAGQPAMVSFSRNSTDVSVGAPYAQVTAQLRDDFGNAVKQAGLGIQVTPMRNGMPVNDLQVNGAAGRQTWQTAADGSVALNLSGGMVFVGSTYTLSAAPAAGGAAAGHNVRVVNSLPQNMTLQFASNNSGMMLPVSVAKAGDPIFFRVRLQDGYGQAVTGYADLLSFGFGEGEWTAESTAASRLHVGDRVSFHDDGNGWYSAFIYPTAAGSLTVTAAVDVNGTPVRASAALTVRPGQPAAVNIKELSKDMPPELCMGEIVRPITLQVTDAYGNETPVTTPVTLLLNSLGGQLQFRSAPDSLPVTQKSIPAGAGSVTMYAVAPAGTGGTIAVSDADHRLPDLFFNYESKTCVSILTPGTPAVVGQFVDVYVDAKGVKGLTGWSADVRVDPNLADVVSVMTTAVAPVTYAPVAVGHVPGLAYDDSALLYPTQPGVDGNVGLFRVTLLPKVAGQIPLQLTAANLWGTGGALPTGRAGATLQVLAAPPEPPQPIIDSVTKLPNARSVTLQFRQPPVPQTAYMIYRRPGLGTFQPTPELKVGMTITGQFTDETVPQDGDYTWEATSMNYSQIEGPVSAPAMLTVDSVPPQLTVSGAATVTSSSYQFRVTTDGMLPLLINGTPVYPAADGTVWWQLKGGTNGLTVRAMDQAGNYTERVLMVTYMIINTTGPARTWTSTADFQTGTLTGLSAASDELKLAAGARAGTWTAQQDSGALRTRWAQVTWQGVAVPGGTVVVKTRTADDLAQLSTAAWTPVGAGGTVTSAPGRFIEVRVELSGNVLTGRSPVVQSVTVNGVKSTR